MINKNKIFTFATILFATMAIYGQRGERIKALKIAFITERLALSSQEAQEFWPVYNAHEDKKGELRRKERTQIRSKLVDFDSLSEKEANALMEQMIALEDEKHALNIAFIKNIGQIISPKKTFLLIKAEEDFKKRLLQQIQKRRQGGN